MCFHSGDKFLGVIINVLCILGWRSDPTVHVYTDHLKADDYPNNETTN